MALSRAEFVALWVESGLVTLDEGRAIVAPLPESIASGEDVARELVRLKKLTVFQAQQILAGRGKSLILGNYILTDKLGQGGMGMVLKAEHRRMKRVVALKVLSPAVVRTKELLQRFQREVEAAARLTHPNIVAAFDADEANGVHYLVMEYVPGKDLASLVKDRGPLTVREAVDLLQQAATGLEFAHAQGIIHRDIKPANLLLSTNGTVKILDMGLARLAPSGNETGGQADLTNTGAVMGTVDYMSPEQALNTKLADERADVYSLGCTLYYLLTGRSVYAGNTLMEKILAHREAPIPELPLNETQSAELSNESRNGLNAILSRMLAKTPDDRLRSMTEVIAALKAVSSGSAVALTPLTGQSLASKSWQPDSDAGTIGGPAPSLNLPTAVEPSIATRMKSRQKQPLPRSVLLGGGAVALATVVALVAVPGLTGKKPVTGPTAKTADDSIVVADKSIDEPSEDLVWPSGEADTAWTGIVSHPTKLAGIRRWQLESTMPRVRTTGAAWSPDSKWLAVSSEDARVRIFERVDSSLKIRHILPARDRNQICEIVWSPDSRWMSWHGNQSDSFQSFDVQVGRQGPNISSLRVSLAAGWNADGTLFAAPGTDAGGSGVFLWNWPEGTLARSLRGNNSAPSESVWSPDASKIAAADEKTLLVWQSSGENLARVTIGEGRIVSIAWHPREDLLAVRLNEPNGLAYYSSHGDLVFQSEISPPNAQCRAPLAWSSDGRWLAVSNRVGSYQLFDARGTPAETILTAYNSGPPLWRPGHSLLLTTGGVNPTLIDVQRPGEEIVPFQTVMQSAAWSPDGRWLAASSPLGELILWDADARQTSHVATSGQTNILTPYWSESAERWLIHAERNVYQPSPKWIVAIGRDGRILQSILVNEGAGPLSLLGLRKEGRELLVRRSNGHRTWLETWRPENLVDPTEIAMPSYDGGPFIAVKPSPANERLLIRAREAVADEAIWLTDPSGKAIQRLVAEPGGYYDGMAFREKGDRFALTWRSKDSLSQELQVWEPTKPSRVLTVRGFSGGGLSFSPDGLTLAVEGRELVLIDLSSGDIIRRFDKGHSGIPGGSWHPTQARVTTTTDGEHITEVDLKTGPVRDLPLPFPLGVCWASDGTQLLATSFAGIVRSFRNQSTASNWTTVLLPDEQWATFSPGGRLVNSSEDATTFLRTIIERDDGTFETLDYGEFLSKYGPKPPLPPIDHKAERDAANALLDAGCRLRVVQNGRDIEVGGVGQIPVGDFNVHAVWMSYNPRCDDSLLAKVARCRRLDFLELVGVNVSNDGLAHLTKLPALRELSIGNLSLTTSQGWQALGKVTPLVSLSLAGSVPKDAFAAVPQLPNLRHISAIGPRPPVDLNPLLSCLQLEAVFVSGVDVDNTPAEKWLKLSRLGILHLQPATRKSVALIDRLPARVQGDIYGFVDDEALVAATRLTTNRLLTISGFQGSANTPWLELRRRWPTDQKIVLHGYELPLVLPASPPRHGLEFDGIAAHVRVPSLTLQGESAWTIEGHVVPDPIASAPFQVLAFVEPREASLYTERNPAALHLRQWRFHVGSGEVSRASAEPAEILLRRQHVAAVWDGEQATLYVDGRPVEGRDSTLLPPYNLQSGLTLGGELRADGYLQNAWSGVVENVRVSKSARYREPFTPPEKLDLDDDTIALYRCDEGSGSKLTDASANGHHGTIIGARWVDEK